MLNRIPRSATREIAKIKAKDFQCKVYTLENCFVGEECDPAHAWRSFKEFSMAKLTYDDSIQRYIVRVHSNWWYYLSETAP